MTHFIVLAKTATAGDAVQAFLKEVWKLYELPELIFTDWDTKWPSEFWDRLCILLKFKRRMSMSFHPQMDRQTDRVNQTLKSYFQTFINYDQND
jgi:hypothetical protein